VDNRKEVQSPIETPKGSHYSKSKGTPAKKIDKDVDELPNPDDDKSCCIVF
jgi:hypothetical protein